MIGQLATLDFTLDQRLHFTQTFKHAVVEVAAKDERSHGRGIQLAIAFRRGDRPRLHVCVTLPIASMAWQIIFE